MEHQLIITLPDELFQPLIETALRQGRTPEDIVIDRLAASFPLQAANGEREQGDITRFFGAFDSDDPNSADNERIDADLAREYGAEQSLAELFGSVNLGRPTGADNESIDRDLARAYAATHEEAN